MSRRGLPGNQLPVKQPQLPPVSALTAARPAPGPAGQAASPGGTLAALLCGRGRTLTVETPRRVAPAERAATSGHAGDVPWACFPGAATGTPAAGSERASWPSGRRSTHGGRVESWGLRPPRGPLSRAGRPGAGLSPSATPRWAPGESRSPVRGPSPLPSRRGSWAAAQGAHPAGEGAHTARAGLQRRPESPPSSHRLPPPGGVSRGLHPSVRPSVCQWLPRPLSLLLPARATHPQLVLLCVFFSNSPEFLFCCQLFLCPEATL